MPLIQLICAAMRTVADAPARLPQLGSDDLTAGPAHARSETADVRRARPYAQGRCSARSHSSRTSTAKPGGGAWSRSPTICTASVANTAVGGQLTSVEGGAICTRADRKCPTGASHESASDEGAELCASQQKT